MLVNIIFYRGSFNLDKSRSNGGCFIDLNYFGKNNQKRSGYLFIIGVLKYIPDWYIRVSDKYNN